MCANMPACRWGTCQRVHVHQNLRATLVTNPTCRKFTSQKNPLVSVKFLSAILGPEMAASILLTPGKMPSFCRKTHVHKIPRLGGGVWGGECRFIFMCARIFLNIIQSQLGSGRGTVGKCAGPKWSKMVQNDHFGQNDLIPNRI